MAVIDLSDKIFSPVDNGVYILESIKYKDKIKDRALPFISFAEPTSVTCNEILLGKVSSLNQINESKWYYKDSEFIICCPGFNNPYMSNVKIFNGENQINISDCLWKCYEAGRYILYDKSMAGNVINSKLEKLKIDTVETMTCNGISMTRVTNKKALIPNTFMFNGTYYVCCPKYDNPLLFNIVINGEGLNSIVKEKN